MKSLIAWWADNHVAANLLMIGIVVAGIIGYSKMEREMEPTITVPGLQINVVWPGASPKDIEEQVVARIEEVLKDVEGLDSIRSVSSESVASVSVQSRTSKDFTKTMNEVENKIASISNFPPDVRQPTITQWRNRNEMIRVAVHGDIGERNLKRLADEYRREVASLPGISVVELFGVRDEEISIEVSESALKRYGITIAEISNAIRANSVNISAGSLRTDAGQYSLRTRNLADTQVDFENIVVKQLPQGAAIRVADLATVKDGFEENEILATLNGDPAVLIQVMSKENMDVVLMSESVRKWLAEKEKVLPKGVKLTLWQDAAVDFNSRMKTIGSSALVGLILVLIVLLLTLRPVVAFWVGVGIATAYAGAFVLLPSVDISLNMLSTFAFLLVLGIVVDDAIIVGERIHSEHESGNHGLSGAIDGAARMSKPVIFGVTTTIIAFMPWLFLSGPTQEFTRQISWVVILALAFSLIEALFILPAHLASIKPYQPNNRFSRFQQRIADSIVNFGNFKYGPVLEKAVARPGSTLSIFLAMMIVVFGGLSAAGHVRSSFMPKIESEQIMINVDLREGTTYERALDILAQLQNAQEELVREVEKNAEDAEKNKIVENWYTRSRRDSVIAIVKLAPPEVRSMSAKDAALRLRELIGPVAEAKQVSVQYSMQDNDPGLQVSVRHPDLNQLQLAVTELKERLRSFSALYDISDSLETASEEIQFDLKPGTEQLGLTLGQVMRQVRQAYYGEEVQRLPREGQDVRVMVRYPLSSRKTLESFENFRIRTNDGREIPLLSIVDVSYAPALKRIEHRDGLRSATVNAYLKEPVAGEIFEELNKNFFPAWEKKYPGLTRKNVGEALEQQRFMSELLVLILIALFGMYFMLAVAFKSYSQPAVILVAVPFAVMGAYIGHWLTGMSFSLMSYFGTIAATGVVINDNLVLIDSYNANREKDMSISESIIKAGKSRFRPILITSVTTFIGLVPLMLDRSSQAAWLQPIVVSLAYGLLVAFFVTLFLVPALLVLGDRFANKRKAFFGKLKKLFGGAGDLIEDNL